MGARSASTGRLLLVGLAAGGVLGAAVGGRSLVDDVPGLWLFGMLGGAGAGAVLGLVTAAASAAVVVPRAAVAAVAAVRSEDRAAVLPSVLPFWWHLLVPVPVTAAAAWWVLQAPLVAAADRVLLTAAAAVACAAWVHQTSAWVLAPVVSRSSARGRR